MPKYLCLQRSLAVSTAPDGAPNAPSPAQMQEMYARFGAWMEQFKANIVDAGGKLGAGKLVSEGSGDGPFVEVKELVGGYMILSAPTLDEAARIASACPGLVRPGSGVEVVEIRGP